MKLDFTTNVVKFNYFNSLENISIIPIQFTIYHVYVKSQDGSIIADDNTTDTFYQIPGNLARNCDIGTVSVTALIEQYNSTTTIITEQNTENKIISIIDFCKTNTVYHQCKN